MDKDEMVSEFNRCKNDFRYFCEKYVGVIIKKGKREMILGREAPKELTLKELSLRLRELERKVNEEIDKLEYETGVSIKWTESNNRIKLYVVIDEMTFVPLYDLDVSGR
jgi:hypothetical protein